MKGSLDNLMHVLTIQPTGLANQEVMEPKLIGPTISGM